MKAAKSAKLKAELDAKKTEAHAQAQEKLNAALQKIMSKLGGRRSKAVIKLTNNWR